jgi:cytochrome c-type biogenesis protein CcmF
VISLLGRAAVLLALAAGTLGLVTGIFSALRRNDDAFRFSRAMTYVFCAAMAGAVGLMEWALLTHDFSVGYVADVGSRATPVWVTIVSLWSRLEGSILLWGLILGIYTAVFAWRLGDRFRETAPWALAVVHGVGLFFAFLIAGVANPFALVSPVPADGPGPNPLLQNHILMVVHPPALYLGFVGMSVPFAIACAALLAGKLDKSWSRELRNWVVIPWGFLSVGILLGGWWSYEVLGWGGYWAWDPVENASFLPWLTATAFLHSSLVTERKDHLKAWTLTLILATFLLTILGTFMTRSGVFNSVHSFTQSDIGPTFLVFLGLALVFSLVLLAARMDRLQAPDTSLGGPVSREAAFLLNNLLFCAFTFTVLLGTVYPLINEALSGERISVGEPYFNTMALPIALAIVFLMGVGPALPWGATDLRTVLGRALPPTVAAVVVGALTGALAPTSIQAHLTFAFSAFALVVTVRELVDPARARVAATGESLVTAIGNVFVRARRRYGGYLVHVGVITIAVGVAASSGYRDQRDVRFVKGEPVSVGAYTLTFLGAESRDEPHRRAQIARVDVKARGDSLGVMEPRLNHYLTMNQAIGTPAVRSTVREDLYLSLVQMDPAAGTASLTVIVEPLVWWIWFGGGILVLGTAVSAWPSRRGTPAPTMQPVLTPERATK